MSVGALAGHLPVTRPAVSQHLRVLKEARLVKDRAEGTRRVYELDREGFASLHEYFDRFWEGALASFKDAVEEHRQPRKRR